MSDVEGTLRKDLDWGKTQPKPKFVIVREVFGDDIMNKKALSNAISPINKLRHGLSLTQPLDSLR